MSAKSIALNGATALRPDIVPVNCDEASKIKVPVAPEANVTFTDDGRRGVNSVGLLHGDAHPPA